MSSVNVEPVVFSDSTTTPIAGSSVANLVFAPMKRRYGRAFLCSSPDKFRGVKVNLFDSRCYDDCRDGQTEIPPPRDVCLKRHQPQRRIQLQDLPTAEANMSGCFLAADVSDTRNRGSVQSDWGVEDSQEPDIVYEPVSTSHVFVDYGPDESTTTSPVLNNSWLDRYGVELGHANMTYMPSQCVSPVHASGSVFVEDDDETLIEPPEGKAVAETSKEEEEVDGRVCAKGLKLIKSTVVVMLQHIINNRLKDECLGCEVDHPSQLRHSCLFEAETYYFEKYYKDITSLLFTPVLKHAIEGLLKLFGIKLPLLKIQGCAETVVCELQCEPYIVERLEEIRESLIDNETVQPVYDAVDLWKGDSKTL